MNEINERAEFRKLHPAHEPVKNLLRTFDSNATPEIAMHRAQLVLFMLARNGWLTGATADRDVASVPDHDVAIIEEEE